MPSSVSGGLTFTQLAHPGGAVCALVSAGSLYCWGNGGRGQIGDNTTVNKNVPTPVSGGLTFTEIAAGNANYDIVCGIVTGGAMYCWGDNDTGDIGDGTTLQRLVPTAVAGGLTFEQFYTNDGNGGTTCGLTGAGVAYCWGANGSGELGDGTTVDKLVPTAVSGGLTLHQIVTRRGTTCGLTPAGALHCWGENANGQVGDGTTVDKLVPTAVSGGLTFNQIDINARSVAGIVGTAPAFTSANGAAAVTGTAMSFTVTTTGTPTPSVSKSGALPAGVTFTDNGDGTASIAGTPATGSAGSYPITITATNGLNATQAFTLTVTTPGAGAVQTPVGNCVTKGGSMPSRGTKRLMKAHCKTNAGQHVGVAVSARMRGDVRYYSLFCKISRNKSTKTKATGYHDGTRFCREGALHIRTYGQRLRLRVTWEAPAKTGYNAFGEAKNYKT